MNATLPATQQIMIFLFVSLLMVNSPALSHAAESDKDHVPDKSTSHAVKTIEGWTVHVDSRLLDGPGTELGDKAQRILAHQLFQITLAVPAGKVKRLQEVPIWLDQTNGELKSEQYHTDIGWLKAHGYDPEMAKCVHIPNATYFTNLRLQHEQPWAILHELAHAYHDQVLGFDNAEIKAAWQRFVDGARYASVLHMDGTLRPHYGLTNEKEFFAEMTETYFGMNDFYPFNAVELKRDEPDIFALLARLWGPLP